MMRWGETRAQPVARFPLPSPSPTHLALGQFHQHFGGRLRQRHLVQDGGAVVGDDDLAVGLADLGGGAKKKRGGGLRRAGASAWGSRSVSLVSFFCRAQRTWGRRASNAVAASLRVLCRSLHMHDPNGMGVWWKAAHESAHTPLSFHALSGAPSPLPLFFLHSPSCPCRAGPGTSAPRPPRPWRPQCSERARRGA